MATRVDSYFNLGSGYRGRILVTDSDNVAGNYSAVRFRLYVRKDSGAGFWNAGGSARTWAVNSILGGSSASGNSSYDYRTSSGFPPGSEVLIADFTRNLPHNAAGQYSDAFSVAIAHGVDNPPGSGSTNPTLTLTNFPEPASGSFASSLITATTARLSATLTTNGNGSSSTQTFQYRKTGDATWISAGTGSPKDLSGLAPSTNYQWRVVTTNNNGNSSTGSTQNFTTLPAAQAFGVFYGRKVES